MTTLYLRFPSRLGEVTLTGDGRLRISGAGEQLVAAAALEAKRLGYQQLWLDVAKHNAAAARLYERVGFRWAEPPPGQAPDDRHCELSMVLGL